MMISFSEAGAPLSVISFTERPISPCACSSGFAIVAEQQMKVGCEP